MIERSEKQIILARHGRRLLNLLDDSPVVPGDTRAAFEHGNQARQILNDAEDDLREWQPQLEPIHFSEGRLESTLMPAVAGTAATTASSIGGHTPPRGISPSNRNLNRRVGGVDEESMLPGAEGGGSDIHPAYRKGTNDGSPSRRYVSGGSVRNVNEPSMYTSGSEQQHQMAM